MTLKRAKIALLLLAVGLIAVLVPVCGCSSQKDDITKSTEPARRTTVPEEAVTQPQGTTPSTQGGASASEAAIAQAKAEGKPVLVKFGSGTCIPCKEIEKNIDQIRPEYDGKVAIVIVDVYDQSENNLVAKYGIETIPTTYFLDKDGNTTHTKTGVMTPDELRQQLNALL